MSFRITVNSWTGDDQDTAIEQMAKLFRMDREKAVKVVGELHDGVSWKFGQQVSDRQGKKAQKHLSYFGFQVELTPAADDPGMGLGINPYSGDEDDDYEEPPKKQSFFARLKDTFNKK